MGLPKSFIPPKEPRGPKPKPSWADEETELLAHLQQQQPQVTNFDDAQTQVHNFGDLMKSHTKPAELPYQRKLVYRDEVGRFHTVVGSQVALINQAGVGFYPNGNHPMMKFLPWHRVFDVDFDYRDPIAQGLM